MINFQVHIFCKYLKKSTIKCKSFIGKTVKYAEI